MKLQIIVRPNLKMSFKLFMKNKSTQTLKLKILLIKLGQRLFSKCIIKSERDKTFILIKSCLTLLGSLDNFI